MLRNSKIVLGVFAFAVILSSCSGLKNLNTSSNDDVYLDPKNDRSAFYKADEPKPVETATATAQAAVPQEADNNPYYADKDFDYDDYYDNQYASRIRRFHNPCGVSYYDSYYTNSYFYNYNPYQYGVSIYNGYNFWGPSYNNYMYVSNYNWGGYYGYGTNFGYNSWYNNGWGWGVGYSYGYNNWYNPYNPYGYNPYYGYNNWYNPYNPYGYGYNPYGYNNGYDYNSYSYYGPRVSHSGSNSRQVINPGMDPMKVTAPNTASNEPKAVAPTDIKRFNQVVIPKGGDTYTKGNTGDNTPHVMNPQLMNSNTGGSTPVSQPVKGKNDVVIIQPSGNGNSTPVVNDPPRPKKGNLNNNQPIDNGNTPATSNEQPRPKKGGLFNSQPIDNGNNNSSGGSQPKPKKGGWFDSQPINNGGNSGGGNNNNNVIKPSGGSSWPSGGGGGGNSGGGSGKVRPR